MGALTRVTCVSVVLAMLSACASSAADGRTPTSTAAPTPQLETGVLEGRVSIGPLTPVERVDVPTPTIPPETFTSRAIDIYQADGATLVAHVAFSPDGSYRVELAPGVYVVQLARSGRDRAGSLPATVTIESGRITQLDIDIDTGIR